MKRGIIGIICLIMLCGCTINNDSPAEVISNLEKTTQDAELFVSDLIQANQMSTLLTNAQTVCIEEKSNDYYSTDEYTLYNNSIANSYTSYYNKEIASQSFHYNCFNVHIIENKVTASVYVEQLIDNESWINHETVLSRYFENSMIDIIEEDDLNYRLSVQHTEDYSYEITVDKSNLEIQSIHFPDDSGPQINVAYDAEFKGNQLLEDLNGPHKKVEIIADVYDEDYSIHLNKTLNVPANWEVVPACFDLHELYTDSSCSTTYSYPGDGIDYHVYLSNARG